MNFTNSTPSPQQCSEDAAFGGQGAIFGVIIAAAVIRLLRNSINLVGISTHLEFAIIGLVILGGVTA